jgi:hypothetical protein
MKYSTHTQSMTVSPKRKRQQSPENSSSIESHLVNPMTSPGDPNLLVMEFMSLKQNQVLTSKDTEVVDQILKGKLNRDQVLLLAKPHMRMKRVKITKRPIQYRGVGLSTFKQMRKPVPAVSHKRVKSNPSSETAKTILDALDKPESTDLKKVECLPNPYAINVPAVTISPANSPAKIVSPEAKKLGLQKTARLVNPFQPNQSLKHEYPETKTIISAKEDITSPLPQEKVNFIFTPKKEAKKQPLFTAGFIAQSTQVYTASLEQPVSTNVIFTPIKGSDQLLTKNIKTSPIISEPVQSIQKEEHDIPPTAPEREMIFHSVSFSDDKSAQVPEYQFVDVVYTDGRYPIHQIYPLVWLIPSNYIRLCFVIGHLSIFNGVWTLQV